MYKWRGVSEKLNPASLLGRYQGVSWGLVKLKLIACEINRISGGENLL